jgi:hypothetical protein
VAGVAELARDRGLDTTGLGVLRQGTSVLVGLPGPAVLARVDRAELAGRASRQVAVARVLEDLGVPAVRALDDTVAGLAAADRPTLGGKDGGGAPDGTEGVVTFWRWEAVAPGAPGPAQVGALAGVLHRTTRGRRELAALPPVDPLGAIEAQVAGCAGDRDAEVVVDLARRLAPVWAAACAAEDPVVVHGDLHADNVLLTDRGPVLADLELAGVGPPAYDVAPQVVAVRRYGRPGGDLDAFRVAYGAGVPTAERVDALVAVYELWVTAWAVANRRLDAAHEREAVLRMARWSGELDRGASGASAPADAPWTLR